MIRMSDLEPFVYYRLKTVVRMPEATNPKKGALYAVFAPDIESEIKYLVNNQNIQFRYLYKYFVEKLNIYKSYGTGQVKVSANGDGSITALLDDSGFKKKFKTVDGVTSYKKETKSNPLKGFNLLYEVNHLNSMILKNPKDHRLAVERFTEVYQFLDTTLHESATAYGFDGMYTNRTLIIPLELWMSPSEMKSTATYNRSTKNIIGRLIYQFGVDQKKTLDMFAGYNVLFIYGDRYIVINDQLPEKAPDNYIATTLRKFIQKCTSAETVAIKEDDPAVEQKEDITPEEDTDEDKAKAAEAQIKSAKAIEVERVIEKSKIDPEKISNEQKKKLEDMVQVTVSDDDPENITVTKLDSIKDEKDVDIVIQAKLEGKSIENYRRDQMLKEKYKTMSYNGRSMEDVLKEEEAYDVPNMDIKIHTVNDSMKSIRSHEFERSYNEQLNDYDCANILLHFGTCKPALYLVSDPIIEDISDSMNKLYLFTVEYEDEMRKRHKFKFKMPKWYQDKYLFLNEQKWNIIHQKVPFPVSKTDSNMCQVATNYNKIRMSRYGANMSAKITKLKKILSGAECPAGVKVTRGNTSIANKNRLTTIEFDELGSSFYRIQFGRTVIYFDLNDAYTVIGAPPQTITDMTVLPFAVNNATKTKYYISGETNKVYDHTGKEYGELSDFIIDEISQVVKNFKDQFNDVSAGTKFAYTRARIMDENVPLILVLGAADPGGLTAVLEKAKINFEFTATRPSVDKDNQGVVPFSDGYLVFDRYPYENSLLMNGLSTFPTKEYSYYDMSSRETYIEIFDIMFNRRNLIDGIENFYYLLIDPITHDILNRVNMPDNFTELLLYANGKLADNSYNIDADYHNCRIRSNEIINAYLYQELCAAYAAWKIGRAPKFSIPEDAVIKDCLSSRIVDSHSKLNLTLEMENDRQIKLKGPGGMNEDRAFTLEKRSYHPSMRGIVGMNSTPSGEVGINRHLTLNCNIKDARGFVEVDKTEYDGTELTTPGELLNVFGPESADIERVAMAISQSKHLVPTAKATPSLISYDMERVVPYLSNDFAFKSKKAGKVVEIANDVMIVQYDDGTYDDIDLSEKPDKNTDGGFFVMNQMQTNLRVGEKFDKNEILAYDAKYINDKDELGDFTANVGTLGRVAIASNGTVYEDACYITDKLAHDLASKITQHKSVIISQFSNIKYIVKKGQEIKANDPLIIFDDTKDEFTSQLLASMADEIEDQEEIVASTAPIISKVSGVVKDIKIYYTVPIESMTPSLQKVIKDYNSSVASREKVIAKYIDPKNANTILTPSTQTEPDSAGRVKGIKVGEGILIEFFIEYLDVMAVGDKLSFLSRIGT